MRLDGGSAWESNPAPPLWRGATGFEDREGHRAPFASAGKLSLMAATRVAGNPTMRSARVGAGGEAPILRSAGLRLPADLFGILLS